MLLSDIRRVPPVPAPECQGGHQWRGCGWNLSGLSPGQGWLDRCSAAGTGTVSSLVASNTEFLYANCNDSYRYNHKLKLIFFLRN